MKNKINNIILIHPGIQYTYRMASAISKSNLVEKVYLYTWFTLSTNSFLAKYAFFKKRVKNIDERVKLYNFPVFELILVVLLKFLTLIKVNKENTPRYMMQVCFGYYLLPLLYFKRKNSLLVLSETAAWPLSYYAKKWGMLVLLDFPSISHEAATKLGITETEYGIKIKEKERQYIDFASNCSLFASNTYKNLTSAKKHFPIWLAAEKRCKPNEIFNEFKNGFHICCLANTEKRKGIDILIKAFSKLKIINKKLFLIGKINPGWVDDFCSQNQIERKSIILAGPLAQQDITNYLLNYQIQLHILASRFDSFGMVVPETMMLGIPNIVSPFVGAGELIENGKNGFIMSDLSDTALLHCINQYTQLSQIEKTSLKENVLLQAENMTWEKYNERVKLVFEEILEELKVGRLETEDRSSF